MNFSYGSVAHDVTPEEIHALDHGVPGGFVLVEEIPAQKDTVHLLLESQLQDLLERGEGILALLPVFLGIT